MEVGTFGPLLHAKFHPHRCNVSPLRGEKPQNRPLSKLNTGRFALRAMLPVKTILLAKENKQREFASDLISYENQNQIFPTARQTVKERQDVTGSVA